MTEETRSAKFLPITCNPDYERQLLNVEASGILDWEQRREGIALFRDFFASGKIKYALFDLRQLTAENDAREEVEFGQKMVEALSEFTDVRAAVVLSGEFLISSSVVLQLQKSGFKMMDFRDMDEARAWLFEGKDPDA